jgi:hypothetical protein
MGAALLACDLAGELPYQVSLLTVNTAAGPV